MIHACITLLYEFFFFFARALWSLFIFSRFSYALRYFVEIPWKFRWNRPCISMVVGGYQNCDPHTMINLEFFEVDFCRGKENCRIRRKTLELETQEGTIRLAWWLVRGSNPWIQRWQAVQYQSNTLLPSNNILFSSSRGVWVNN